MSFMDEDTPLATIARWARAIAILGAIAGLFLMFTRTPPIAESGRKPDSVLWYGFWVPVMAVFGSMMGAGLGVLAVMVSKLKEWAGLG